MTTKVTFKNYPKETGLAAVGYPHQSIECKIKKQVFGMITAPNWQTKDGKWGVRVMIQKTEPDNLNCGCWQWITFKARFDSAEQAKQWLQDHIDNIQQRYTLRFEGD